MIYNIAIIGASGYTGAELIRLIASHPNLKIKTLVANSKAGQSMRKVFPHLSHLDLPDLVAVDDVDFEEIDLCFCAMPHQTSQEMIAKLPDYLKVIDLSADFRLRDPQAYEHWYNTKHLSPDLQSFAVYGLTEFYRAAIRTARLVAGTGCNAATGQYILRPLIKDRVIDLDDIILDMKCAVSGAGRALKQHLQHAELSEGYNAYAVGGTHRHLGEFDQEFSELAGRPVKIQFTPHLMPVNRGILATAYVKAAAENVFQSLQETYENEPFIHMLDFGQTPSTHNVRGSNFVHIGVSGDRITGRSIVIAAMDNLTKGSSGQAVQNANLMLGLEETIGLMHVPLFP